MEEKQIFATLEVSDHEVRMIVGEFFNTRFNILKVERVPVDALSYDTITDQDALTAAIAEAAREAGETLGAKIEKVILCVPALNTKRKPVRVSVPIEGIDGVITAQDIKTAVDSAQNVRVERDLALIQTVCVKYTIDGIASRRIPIGEHASQLTVDIDLICADRNMAYTLVGCTEQAGLQVMDIFLDVYAVAKEAALFEQSVDSNVLIMKMERRATTLGILSKGRLRDCVVVPFGVGDIAEPLV
ncbi:MAG: cell division protein FtsA, partial [Solobacterium sp.]|nr:cell division protein FtsA [Solobacterium sp.]